MSILSAIGGALGIAGNLWNASKERKTQKDFAQKGIRWKVADATAAGLHPLAALGANTMSYSPVQVGDMAGPLADMGQNIDRARKATSSEEGRVVGQVNNRLSVERQGLENELLRAQINSTNATTRAQLGPPMPHMMDEKLVDPQRTKGLNVGVGVKSNPYFSDAQTYEDRYGEVGGSALGLVNVPADILYKAWKAYEKNVYKKYRHTAPISSGGDQP